MDKKLEVLHLSVKYIKIIIFSMKMFCLLGFCLGWFSFYSRTRPYASCVLSAIEKKTFVFNFA